MNTPLTNANWEDARCDHAQHRNMKYESGAEIADVRGHDGKDVGFDVFSAITRPANVHGARGRWSYASALR